MNEQENLEDQEEEFEEQETKEEPKKVQECLPILIPPTGPNNPHGSQTAGYGPGEVN